MRRYAATTAVSVEQSRLEIERVLSRYGATAFGYATSTNPPSAMIEFVAHKMRVRFVLMMPTRDDKEVSHKRAGGRPGALIKRTDTQIENALEQARRQRWRALKLSVLAKLEAVESKISTFEDEFLAHIIDPHTGRTMAELVKPQLPRLYEGKQSTLRLTGPGEDDQSDSDT